MPARNDEIAAGRAGMPADWAPVTRANLAIPGAVFVVRNARLCQWPAGTRGTYVRTDEDGDVWLRRLGEGDPVEQCFWLDHIEMERAAPPPDMAAALSACLDRLNDVGEGDTPTAQAARDALRRAGL